MVYRILADLVFSIHLAFIVFVVLGGLLLLRSRKWVWPHLPSISWSALAAFFGWICPLTPLESWLRQKAGEQGLETTFIEEYLLPLLYPEMLTRELQTVLGLLVIAINAPIYLYAFRRRRKSEPA